MDGRGRHAIKQPVTKELPDVAVELDSQVPVQALAWTDRGTVLRHLDVTLYEPVSPQNMAKALMMLRHATKVDPGLTIAERPNLLDLTSKQLGSEHALVRACAAACYAALAGTSLGRTHMFNHSDHCGVGRLVAFVSETAGQGRDGRDVHMALVALGSLAAGLQQARDALLQHAGALQLLVDIVRGSLPQLILGQTSKAGPELTEGPYAAHKPMPHACHAALGVLQNLIPSPQARVQLSQAGLVSLLGKVITAAEHQRRPDCSWLSRARCLGSSIGIHHVLQSYNAQQVQNLSAKAEAAALKAEHNNARGLIAAQHGSATRVMQALAQPLAPSLQLAVETLQEARGMLPSPGSSKQQGGLGGPSLRQGGGGGPSSPDKLAASLAKLKTTSAAAAAAQVDPEDVAAHVGQLADVFPLTPGRGEGAEGTEDADERRHHRHHHHHHKKHHKKHRHKEGSDEDGGEGAEGESSSAKEHKHRRRDKHRHGSKDGEQGEGGAGLSSHASAAGGAASPAPTWVL